MTQELKATISTEDFIDELVLAITNEYNFYKTIQKHFPLFASTYKRDGAMEAEEHFVQSVASFAKSEMARYIVRFGGGEAIYPRLKPSDIRTLAQALYRNYEEEILGS
jgi:hypothetical protein